MHLLLTCSSPFTSRYVSPTSIGTRSAGMRTSGAGLTSDAILRLHAEKIAIQDTLAHPKRLGLRVRITESPSTIPKTVLSIVKFGGLAMTAGSTILETWPSRRLGCAVRRLSVGRRPDFRDRQSPCRRFRKCRTRPSLKSSRRKLDPRC